MHVEMDKELEIVNSFKAFPFLNLSIFLIHTITLWLDDDDDDDPNV